MADIQELRGAPRIDCYSRSLNDDNVEHGLVIDISETGAGLTVLKDTPLFEAVDPDQSASNYGCIRLSIYHPDSSCESGLNINANIAWLDHEYSNDRLKLGVRFSELDDSQASHVDQFIDWIQKEEHYFLHCEVEIC